MVDDATHGTSMRPLPASTAAASNLALPYMQTIHKHVTSLVRTRQCVNVLDHDVYVDCDGDLDMLLGSKGSANRVLCSTWAMSHSWRASGYWQRVNVLDHGGGCR